MAPLTLGGVVLVLCGAAIGIAIGVIVCQATRHDDQRSTRRVETVHPPLATAPPTGRPPLPPPRPRSTGAPMPSPAGCFTCRLTGRVFTGTRRAMVEAGWRVMELRTPAGARLCIYAPTVSPSAAIDDLEAVRAQLGGEVIELVHYCAGGTTIAEPAKTLTGMERQC